MKKSRITLSRNYHVAALGRDDDWLVRRWKQKFLRPRRHAALSSVVVTVETMIEGAAAH